jgi:hypothetical protein
MTAKARAAAYGLVFEPSACCNSIMESKLAEFVNRLKDAAGENVQSVVLFGSAVAGEFSQQHSNLNILCLLENLGSAELSKLHPVVVWWIGEGNPAPLVFTFEELSRSAGLFAIEMFDVKLHHRILFGPDWLDRFELPLHLHRQQVERELHLERLRLRQAILAEPGKSGARLEWMLASFSRLCTLFRHALTAAGEPQPQTKRESIAAMAAWTGADPSGFEVILEYREGKRKRKQIDLEAALHSYLEFTSLAADEISRRFAQGR